MSQQLTSIKVITSHKTQYENRMELIRFHTDIPNGIKILFRIN